MCVILWRRLHIDQNWANFDLVFFPVAVYPQKQQPYAYGYAYPGPYYHGAAYGPYAQYWVEKPCGQRTPPAAAEAAWDTQKTKFTAASVSGWFFCARVRERFVFMKVPVWKWRERTFSTPFSALIGAAPGDGILSTRVAHITRLNFFKPSFFFKLMNTMNALGYHLIQLCECLRVECVRDMMLSI